MWSVEYRELKPEEREELRKLLGKCSGSKRGALGFLLGALAGLALFRLVPANMGMMLVVTLAGGFLGAWSLRARVDIALHKALRRDLRHGKVQVFHVASRHAVRLNGPGDVLAGYFVEIGDGQVMFVEPREWDDAGEDAGPEFERLFPCRRFSLVRAPLSNVDLDFVCEGAYVDPVREIDLPSSNLPQGWVKDGETFPAPLDTLERELERLHPDCSFRPGPAAVGELVEHDPLRA